MPTDNKVSKAKFLKDMKKLAQVFPEREITKELIDIYWEVLNDLTAEEWEKAVTGCFRDCKYFPKPAELREYSDVDLPECWGRELR